MTETRIHADHCARRRAASEAYRRDWPGHCRTCGGWGALYTPVSDAIDGAEPCPGCVETGRCPRCAAGLPEGCEEGPCRFCGWSDRYDGDPSHGGPDCCCYDQPDPDAAWRADHEDDGEPQ